MSDTILDFETAMTELEKIVSGLESGRLSLEESLKMYEKGTELLDICEKKLKEGRTRIEILTRKGEEMIPEAFGGEDSDEI